MPSPNLEIFRFGFYVFFPVYVMFKVGDPEWYEKHVIPYKEMIWPAKDEYKPPRTPADMKAELARFRAEREARKAKLEGLGTAPTDETGSAAAATATPVADAVASSQGQGRWSGWPSSGSKADTNRQAGDRLV